MTQSSDIKEIREDISSLKVDIAKIKTNLENHLAHHMAQKNWAQWLPTALVAILALAVYFKGG